MSENIAPQARSETARYIAAYQRALRGLVQENGGIPAEYTFMKMKKQARQIAGDEYPCAYKAVQARLQQYQGKNGKDVPPPATELEKVGYSIISTSGNATKVVRQEFAPPEDSIDTTVDRDGITGRYQEVAWMTDLLLADPVMAVLTGYTENGISTARHTATKDGFGFERVMPSELGIWQESKIHGLWRVVKRPEMPVDEEPSLEELLEGVSKEELLEALLKALKE